MKAFDWKPLLTQHRIFYIERGANVKRGEVNIACPWCGAADPSQHLGINLETGWYSCWRNKAGHSGKSPLRLIMKLLHVPYEKAREIAGLGEGYIDPEGFDAVVARLMGRAEVSGKAVERREFLDLDKHFIPILDDRMKTRRFWNYLYTRGFLEQDIVRLCADYQLLACRDGRWSDRLIIPYFLDGRLIAWTGRAIGKAEIRYKDLSIEESLIPIKQTLFNHDAVFSEGKRDTLTLHEGPIDALKMDFYGKEFGVRSMALSTNSMSDHQIYMLQGASLGFRQTIVMMDNKTEFGLIDSMKRKQELRGLGIENLRIEPTPYGRGDAGALMAREVRRWAEQITRR